MNKKTYQQPTIEVVKMQQSQMLCGSPKELEGTPEEYQELG